MDNTNVLDPRVPRYLSYPFGIGGSGVPNTTDAAGHLRDLILQVLLTAPGERINLPQFGVGIQRLLFTPSSDAMRASVQLLISYNLQKWLGDILNVEQVSVGGEPGLEETVTIEITYTVKATRLRQSLQVQV